ncbi:STT3 domain-containing protein [Campylobacter lanienae]|uniref:Undecaprenyl-diphosphooligosaccharide--protein glycotransferase n=1 Tax=Campylobacter lanienae NCTC 13004 TaxID=1031753 RepID=A0A1X9SLK4_9BACT|nr:STT3 domain-containing protein [Campylobacter lanienae]ARQ97113.1 undecaprenyl-diphosphooligosaccharide--protein glycotransferase [Campylobacter lanienae NCTC 13004]
MQILNKYQIPIFIIIAYLFAILCRMEWVIWASGYSDFIWNNQLMISTNDGYAYAEGARDMIAGFHQPNDLSYYGTPLSTITFLLAEILPFSLETIILYLSIFLASLIVIPIILIGKEFNQTKAFFIASLLASIANSYYNRTMAGYYDTDMLVIVLPLFTLWGLIRLHFRGDLISFLIIALSMLAYNWWYPSSYTLCVGIAIFYAIYTFVFERKNIANYQAILFMILAITSAWYSLRIALIFGLFGLIYFRSSLLNFKVMSLLFVAVLSLFAIFGGLNPIWFQAKFYLFRDLDDSISQSFRFYNVNQTIMESGRIDLELFTQRISGHWIVFIFGFIGYILLCKKFRIFLITIPMLGLGFLALKGGLRFTIYAVPIIAMGFGFLLFYLLDKLRVKRLNSIAAFITILALTPSLIHIYYYKPSSVLFKNEVSVLDRLGKVADREDYTLAWWDYGYAIRYYSDTKTLIDGGKHLGRENYAVSYALTMPPNSSANMARLEVEYTEKGYKQNYGGKNLEQILKDYNYNELDKFLSDIKSDKFNLPSKSRDIYYFLPDRMLSIFPIVSKFSRLDILNGKEWGDPFFVIATNFTQVENGIALNNGVIISNDATYIELNGQKFRVNSYIETKYDENMKLKKTIHNIDNLADIYLIYMVDYGRFILLDKEMFNSTFIQLYVLENYDKTPFEPVILDPTAKVYKLKR